MGAHMRLAGMALIVVASGLWITGPQSVAPTPLAMESFLEGRWPSRPAWSPDGRYISFLWTDWVTQDLYVVPASGGKPVRLTHDSGFIGGPTWNSSGQYGEWAPDSSAVLHATSAGLALLPVPSGEPDVLPGTAGAEQGARFSLDGGAIAFVKGGDIHLHHLAEGRTRQLTRDGQIRGVTWSPDGKWLSTSVGLPATRLTVAPDYVGPLITFSRARSHPGDVAIVSIATGGLRPVLPSGEDHESVLAWLPDSTGLILQRTSLDQKERTIFVYDIESGRERLLYRQRDEKYLATNDQAAEVSPDGRTLLLTSDQDGWNHLYTVPLAGGPPRQLTRGSFEVSFPAWSRDGSRIFFSSSEQGSDQRHLYAVPVSGGERTRLTSRPGVDTTLVVSPADDTLAFIRSDPARLPDLWVQSPHAKAAVQLTDSMPAPLKAFNWQTPRIVSYPGKDGLPIKAQLFIPVPFDPAATYPAIVHVHQAAIYQEAFLGPGPHKDNVGWYGWHQRMAGRGFVILNVDYRGSSGYGRDFRTANHLDIGVGDAADVVQGVEYLKTLGYVDPKKVGVYGMSYGGHMVLTLLSKYPNTFQAGINIAGVFDYELEIGPWAVRNSWMYARLGTPEQNPEAYWNASSINFIDDLTSPLLTLQGTADVHVTPLQSFKLADELLKRGKRFESEWYPGEVHFFARRQSWMDAFGRMERFLDEWLGASRR